MPSRAAHCSELHRKARHCKDTRLASRQLGAKRVSFEIQLQRNATQRNATQRSATQRSAAQGNAKIRV